MNESETARQHNRETDLFLGAVVYEDTPTRNRAIQLCRSLEEGLQPGIQSRFTWWKFEYLRDETISSAATEAAVESHMILFSAHAERELPEAVESWIDNWVRLRKDRDGLLVALIGLSSDDRKGLTPIHNYLREISQRTRMDFLSQVSGSSGEGDFSFDALLPRADTMTSFMSRILESNERR